MKKDFALITLAFLFFIFMPVKSSAQTIRGGISMIEQIPHELFGSWAVSSIQTYSSSPKYSALPSVDYWNIYRYFDVLTLENPQTNAKASVTLDSVKNNTVTFTRKSSKNNEEIIETPTITIEGENFWGNDKMVIKKYKNGALVSTNVVEFSIRGRKIGGASTEKLLN